MNNTARDGHTTSDDLLDEHDEEIDNMLKTSVVLPQETTPDKAEAEAETEEFDDNETADKAKMEAEKADPEDKRNSP
jgi:hypothetical protein